MSVVSKIQGFLSRHKNKFLVGGILAAGTVGLAKYTQYKLREFQEKQTIEFFDRNRKLGHYENITRTTNQTLLNFSTALQDLISEIVNTEEIIERLKTNPDNKVELWNSLKLLVFTKVGLIVYSSVMLAIIVNVQLMVMGGYLFSDSTVPTEIQEKYLSLCQNFLNEGVKRLAKVMETEMTKYVSILDLTKQLKLGDIENIYWSLQVSLSSNKDGPIEQFRKYFIADEAISDSTDVYDNILKDTADFLDSDEVKTLSTHLVNQGFILLGDHLAELYSKSDTTASNDNGDGFKNPFDLKKPLARLLPLLNGILVKQSFPQLFIQQLISNKKLQTFSANVYESLL